MKAPTNQPNEQHAAIFTASRTEYQAVQKQLDNLREVKIGESIYEQGEFAGDEVAWQVLIYEVVPNNQDVAIALTRAHDFFKPAVAFFIGSANGIKDVKPGDVVVANKVYNYESGEIEPQTNEILTRPETGNSSFGLVERARVEARGLDWLDRLNENYTANISPTVLIGPVAAGGIEIRSTKNYLYNLIHSKFNDTIALDTGGHGFLRAAHTVFNMRAIVMYNITEVVDQPAYPLPTPYASAFAFQVLAKLNLHEAISQPTEDSSLSNLTPLMDTENSFSAIFKHPTRQYRQAVLAQHGNLKLNRFGSSFSTPLEAIFLDLHLKIPPNSQQIEENPILKGTKRAKKEAAQRQNLEGAVVWDYLHRKPGNLILSGPFGTGKSTLLQHMACEIAAGKRLSGCIPVLLSMSELLNLAQPLSETTSLVEVLLAYFKSRPVYKNLTIPSHWLEQQLKRGKCVVLLDGLDEIGQPDQRQKLVVWLNNQIGYYRKSRFIIATRPGAYPTLQDHLEQPYLLTQVQPFNRKQQRSFLEKWYLLSNNVAGGSKEKAEQQTKTLYEKINNQPSTRDIAVNPLMLTMLAITYRAEDALPTSRLELYDKILQYALVHRQPTPSDPLSVVQKLELLQRVADHMMVYQFSQISALEAQAVLEKPLARFGKLHLKRSIMKLLQESTNNLWLEIKPGVWGFAHFSFQEYLQAAYWLANPPTDWTTQVSASSNVSWWYNTLTLYATSREVDATLLVQTCLAQQTLENLTFVAYCLTETTRLDPIVRQQANTVLHDNLSSADEAKRHLAAEVALSLRLRKCQVLEEGREIDASYPTWAEYTLFLAETRAQGKYYQPDHWTSNIPALEEMTRSVCGIRAEDAQAFCDWLTSRSNQEYKYELPTAAEAAESVLPQHPNLTIWCEDKTLGPLPKATEDSIKKEISKLSNVFLPYTLDLAKPLPSLPHQGEALLYPLLKTLGLSPGLTYQSGHNNPHDKRNRVIIVAIVMIVGLFIFGVDGYILVENLITLVLEGRTVFTSELTMWMIGSVLFLAFMAWGLLMGYDVFTTNNNRIRAIKQFGTTFVDLGRSFTTTRRGRWLTALLGVVLFIAGITTLIRAFNIHGWLGLTLDCASVIAAIPLGLYINKVMKKLGQPKKFSASADLNETLETIYRSVQNRDPAYTPKMRQKLAYALLLKLGRLLDCPEVETNVAQNDLAGLLSFLDGLEASTTAPVANRGRLFKQILAVLQATTPAEVRQAERRYASILAEFVRTGYSEMQQPRETKELENERTANKALYWWLQVMIARQDNKDFPVWESVRFVRHRQTLETE